MHVIVGKGGVVSVCCGVQTVKSALSFKNYVISLKEMLSMYCNSCLSALEAMFARYFCIN